MKTSYGLAFMLSLVLSLPVVARGQHNFTDCKECHLTAPQEGVKGFFVRGIGDLCGDCHRIEASISHPVGILPGMALPDGFPVDWDGRLTCSTCHDPHAAVSADNRNRLRGEARGVEFCSQCHRDRFGSSRRHPVIAGYAHGKRWTSPEPEKFGLKIDEVSRDCLLCHDGVIAKTAEVSFPETVEMRHGMGLSHPIGVDYAAAAAENRQLRSPESLSPSISLYAGKIGCASCHSLYSKEPVLLVFDNVGSALCLECHLK